MNRLKITAISALAEERLRKYYEKPGRKDQKLVCLKIICENPFTLQVDIKNLADNRMLNRLGGFRRAFDDGSFSVLLAQRLEKSWAGELDVKQSELDKHLKIEEIN